MASDSELVSQLDINSWGLWMYKVSTSNTYLKDYDLNAWLDATTLLAT